MAQPQKKRPKYVSGRLTFSYPKLTEADTKFKEEGEYSVKGIGPALDPDVQRLIKLADEGAADSLAEAKANAKTPKEAKGWESKYLPYVHVTDDEDNPTGEVEFKFTMKASGVSKKTGKAWTRKPAIFDAKGKPVVGDIRIGGGTIGKVSFEVQPYAPTQQVGASVKFALEGVQIIELHEGGQKSAKDLGFGEEDGYERDDSDNKAEASTDSPADADAPEEF